MFSFGRRDAFPAMLQGGEERPMIWVRGGEGPLPDYRFDDVRVDTAAFRVERGGEPVPLEPKAFDLLVLLIERQGQVVTKQEIQDAVWRQTAVSDNALTRIVAHLRKALDDDAREARYIETVPTRGYRWLVPVERETSGARPVEAGVPWPPRRWGWRAVTVVLVVVVAGAAALGLARRHVQGRTAERMGMDSLWPTQVTVSSGLDVFPALSPDGGTLAYATDRSGGFEIAVRSLTAGAREIPLTADSQQNVEPAWSRDGQFVAYHSMVRGGVWIVPALGGVARRVTDFGSRPAWSPDGRRLAFQSDPLADIGPSAYGANTRSSTIWVVDIDGGNLRRLTAPGRPLGGHASPVWSPDGRSLAFVTYSAAPSQMWRVGAGGGTPTLLYEGEVPIFDPVFAHDGGAVYFATGAPFVFRVPLSPETGLPQGDPVPIATPALASPRHLSISGDSRRLALAGLNLKSNLGAVQVSPRTGLVIGDERALTDDTLRRKSTPLFSPDGRWIAFTAGRAGSGTDVWVMNTADGSATPVTTSDPTAPKSSGLSYFRPSWFPDSERLAFIGNDGRRTSLQAADLTSRRPRPLLEAPAPGPPGAGGRDDVIGALDFRLSPDGRVAAYSRVDPATGRPRIYVRPLDGAGAEALTSGDEEETYPVWSPDGAWIAIEGRDDRGTYVGVRPARGGPLRRLTTESGQSWVHSWAPDNDRILFAGQRGGVWNVWWVSRSSSRQAQVTSYTRPNTFVRYPSWSPRGDRIVFERGELKGNIWIADIPTEMSTRGWRGHRGR
jgi:Tol biopolymer transport system component/DNA-binding winged helix-turn-helix (wHTH) protein